MRDIDRGILTPEQLATLTPEHFTERANRIGLPVTELCQRSTVTKAMYYRWKRKDGTITLTTLQKLATQLWAAEVVHQLSNKKDTQTQPENR